MIYKIKPTEVIIFPTDTIYGLGCKFDDEKAIEKIFSLKKRAFNQRLSVLIHDLSQIEKYITIDKEILKLAKNFWPGALTIIVPLKKSLKYYDKNIGIRIPDCQIALDLLKSNGPLATTSVNLSGEKEIDDYDEIYQNYHNQVACIIKKNKASSGISSTVILLENNNYKILREGVISAKEIAQVLEK